MKQLISLTLVNIHLMQLHSLQDRSCTVTLTWSRYRVIANKISGMALGSVDSYIIMLLGHTFASFNDFILCM